MSGGFVNTSDGEAIEIGDKVDIVTQSGQVYRTMIEDQVNNGPFLASVPNKKGTYMFVHQGDDIYLVFYRETGRYIAQMKVVALEKRGESADRNPHYRGGGGDRRAAVQPADAGRHRDRRCCRRIEGNGAGSRKSRPSRQATRSCSRDVRRP